MIKVSLIMDKLKRHFYCQNTREVAQALLGKYLVHNVKGKEQIGKIVEVEAYLGVHDLAAHTSKGYTKRTAIMFGPPGFAYVYLIYGIYHCLNVVTEEEGHGSAVLIRAVEPIKGIDKPTKGPGLLTRAMHIDKSLNGHDLLSNNLYIAHSYSNEVMTIIKRPRIGVAYAGVWAKKLLRFYIKDNPFVSKK